MQATCRLRLKPVISFAAAPRVTLPALAGFAPHGRHLHSLRCCPSYVMLPTSPPFELCVESPSLWTQLVAFFCFSGAYAVEVAFVLLELARMKQHERLRKLATIAAFGLSLIGLALVVHYGVYLTAFGSDATEAAIRAALASDSSSNSGKGAGAGGAGGASSD